MSAGFIALAVATNNFGAGGFLSSTSSPAETDRKRFSINLNSNDFSLNYSHIDDNFMRVAGKITECIIDVSLGESVINEHTMSNLDK